MGRGLGALIDDADIIKEQISGIAEIELSRIEANPFQPRTTFDQEKLEELSASIREIGLIQPITLRKSGDGKFQIITGERRFRASQMAGLYKIPAFIREAGNDAMLEMALVENIQREDLNPLEEAQGLQRLVQEFGHTHEQAAQAVGRSRSAASNLLRLLQLTEPVQTMLMAGDIDMGHARALLGLEQAEQITTANQVAARKLSVRETEALVKKVAADATGAGSAARSVPAKSGDVLRVEEELSDLLMAQVEVRMKKSGKQQVGELAIQFGSLDALNGLIERLRKLP